MRTQQSVRERAEMVLLHGVLYVFYRFGLYTFREMFVFFLSYPFTTFSFINASEQARIILNQREQPL
jgi:hypothetical protein